MNDEHVGPVEPARDAEEGRPAPTSGQPTGGLDPKIGAMLSYLLLGWIGGLIMYLTQKHPEVRFHAAQSILVFGPLHLLQIILSWVIPGMMFTGLGAWAMFSLLSLLVGLVAFVLWIFLSIKGYQLEHVKMPIVGDLAEQWAAR